MESITRTNTGGDILFEADIMVHSFSRSWHRRGRLWSLRLFRSQPLRPEAWKKMLPFDTEPWLFHQPVFDYSPNTLTQSEIVVNAHQVAQDLDPKIIARQRSLASWQQSLDSREIRRRQVVRYIHAYQALRTYTLHASAALICIDFMYCTCKVNDIWLI